MKKVINRPDQVVAEMLDGFVAAYGRDVERVPGVNGLAVKRRADKVAIVIGGGSGHEPLFLGYIGSGLADGVAVGNVFAAPTPDTIYEVAKRVDAGKGILFLIVNYAGDVMNFELAAEQLADEGVPVQIVSVHDDVASAPAERSEERRGIAGFMFALKMAGAAAQRGHSLEEVARIAEKASRQIRSIGVALTPAVVPTTGRLTFTLGDDEIEFGMGIHGEPGVKRTQMMPADELTAQMMAYILDDLPFQRDDEVCVLVNGLGATTLMELLIVNRKVADILQERGIRVYDTDVCSYCTTQEMGGFSISLVRLDEELKALYDEPACSPYYRKPGRGRGSW